MIVLEYKLKGKQHQYNAIDDAIRTTQFVRNKAGVAELAYDFWG